MFRALSITLAVLATPIWADTTCHRGSFSFASSSTNMSASGSFSANGDGYLTIISNGSVCAISVTDSNISTFRNCDAAKDAPHISDRIADPTDCLSAAEDHQ